MTKQSPQFPHPFSTPANGRHHRYSKIYLKIIAANSPGRSESQCCQHPCRAKQCCHVTLYRSVPARTCAATRHRRTALHLQSMCSVTPTEQLRATVERPNTTRTARLMYMKNAVRAETIHTHAASFPVTPTPVQPTAAVPARDSLGPRSTPPPQHSWLPISYAKSTTERQPKTVHGGA